MTQHGKSGPGPVGDGFDGSSRALTDWAFRTAEDRTANHQAGEPTMLAGRRLWTLMEAAQAICALPGCGLTLTPFVARVFLAAAEGQLTMRDIQSGASVKSGWLDCLVGRLFAQDFNVWLHEAGFCDEFRLPVGDAGAGGDRARQAHAPSLRREKRSSLQDEAILSKLRDLGVDPLRMPRAPKGNTKWPLRARVQAELGAEYTDAVMLKAWTRLRRAGRIVDERP